MKKLAIFVLTWLIFAGQVTYTYVPTVQYFSYSRSRIWPRTDVNVQIFTTGHHKP